VDGSCKAGEGSERIHTDRVKDGQRDRWLVHVRMERAWRGLREGTYRQSEGRTEGQVDGSCKDGEGLERAHTDRVTDGQRDRWTVHVRMGRAQRGYIQTE
jgi:hypothetical protein